jgi:hypothetical protein
MNKFHVFLAFLCFSNSLMYSQAPAFLWAKSATGSATDVGKSTATDASGNVFVLGTFMSSNIVFGSTTLINTDNTGNSHDIFLVKYDPSGNVLWAKSAGDQYNDNATALTVDVSGHIIITGQFGNATITFGTTVLTNSGLGNIFLVKYDTSGNVIWAKNNGGIYFELPKAIVSDTSGNIYITGDFYSPNVVFGTDTLTNTGTSNDIFWVKYNSSGIVQWAKCTGGSAEDQSTGISLDALGNIFITGTYTSAVLNFGASTLINFDNTGNSSDIFIAKFNNSGNPIWAKDAGGNSNDLTQGITSDAAGNTVVLGSFQSSSITFGTILTNAGSGTNDIFISRYDPSGNPLWAIRAGGTNEEMGASLITDVNSDIVLTGMFLGSSVTFGSSTLTNPTVNTAEIFIVKYTSAGTLVWTKKPNGQFDEIPNSITTDITGNIIITGHFNSPLVAFGSSTLTLSGDIDMFVTKLSGTTGIAENSVMDNVNVFPNPSDGKFRIKSSRNIGTGIKSIVILNSIGEMIFESRSLDNSEIDLSSQAKGIYFILITNEDKTISTEKLILR